jgi:hypothetical protein
VDCTRVVGVTPAPNFTRLDVRGTIYASAYQTCRTCQQPIPIPTLSSPTRRLTACLALEFDVPSVGGRPVRTTPGLALAVMSGTLLIREACVRRACNIGPRPNVFHVAAGQPTPIGICNEPLTNGSKHRSAAKAETTGYARSFRRASDWQPRDPSGSGVWCQAMRRCALTARFPQ